MSSNGQGCRVRARKVAIIGAGPSGIAAAKSVAGQMYLLAERAFDEIKIFEQRSEVGGLWIYTPCPKSFLEALSVPQTDAHQGAESPLSSTKDQAIFLSPVYDELETNIPRGLMGFSDLDWPRDCQLFPTHGQVLDYIETYAEDVRHLVQFSTQVLDVRLTTDEKWSLTTWSTQLKAPNDHVEHIFDAVVVANGHFRVDYIPRMKGLAEWHHKFPDSIYHSKLYRNADDFAGRKVLIVGNSASGIDIGAQIKHVCKKPLVQSSRSESYLQLEPPPDQTARPEIQELDASTRTVSFVDGSEEADIDAIMFCTGYMYNLPFLESLQPSLISSGERVQHLYKHIFYYPQPTLSFLVLNQKVIPFPTAEAQAAIIARFLAGRLELPSSEEMEKWEQAQLAQTTRLRDFHLLKFPKDADYINELHDWACEVDAATETVSKMKRTAPRGKTPPHWSELQYWTRERFPDIKRAFQSYGEGRHSKRSLKDVGFDYDAWKAEHSRQ